MRGRRGPALNALAPRFFARSLGALLSAGFRFFKSEGYAKSVHTDLMTWAYVMLAVNY